jgi:hypothetical protein
MLIIRGVIFEIIKGLIISAIIWTIKETYKDYKKENKNAIRIPFI